MSTTGIGVNLEPGRIEFAAIQTNISSPDLVELRVNSQEKLAQGQADLQQAQADLKLAQ